MSRTFWDLFTGYSSKSGSTAVHFGGFGRTFCAAVRTKHTAVTVERPEQRLTVLTFVEENTLIGRHYLDLLVTAARAGKGRLE
jgi:hypothetical protein